MTAEFAEGSEGPDPDDLESAEEALEGDGDAVVADESEDADDADGFMSGDVTESGASADANDDLDSVSRETTESVELGDTDVDEELAEMIDTEIHELAAERDTFKDIAQRLQADFENYRKRMSSQMSAEIDRATGRMAEALLPVLDAAEAAYVQHPDEIGPLLNLMLSELRKQGLEVINLLDQPFDPNLAEAVAHEPGDGGEPVVAEVLRSGYTWNGRTLRPAMVRTRD